MRRKWILEEWMGERWAIVKRFATLEEANDYAENRAGCHRIRGA